jgi:hypothetical protein
MNRQHISLLLQSNPNEGEKTKNETVKKLANSEN